VFVLKFIHNKSFSENKLWARPRDQLISTSSFFRPPEATLGTSFPAKVIRCWVVNNSLEGKSWRMAVKASKWGT